MRSSCSFSVQNFSIPAFVKCWHPVEARFLRKHLSETHRNSGEKRVPTGSTPPSKSIEDATKNSLWPLGHNSQVCCSNPSIWTRVWMPWFFSWLPGPKNLGTQPQQHSRWVFLDKDEISPLRIFQQPKDIETSKDGKNTSFPQSFE